MEDGYRFDTRCVQAGYKAESGQPQVLPIVQNTTYRYYDAADIAAMFDLDSPDFMYSRLGSPTPAALERKMASLEGGTGATATSSGQAATFITVASLAQAGDHIMASRNIYGGTYNLLDVSLRRFGIICDFIDQDAPLDQIVAQAHPATKAVFAETLANPVLSVLDFDKFKALSQAIGVPLVVDNTLATPALCRPIEFGADIVLHSTTKYADGHASAVGGMVVEAGTFDWGASDAFPLMTAPDESYHGTSFFDKFGASALSIRLHAVGLRDFGCAQSPMNAYLTFQGLQTLSIRMERHSRNALDLARYLAQHPLVDWVTYPGLPGDDQYELACKYLPAGAGGVLSFGLKGGREAGERFLSDLELASMVVHVGDIRTSVLHPASTTHRQLSEEDQRIAGIRPELIRVSVGLEDIADIIDDFDQALSKAHRG